MSDPCLLIGDIGGTNARFALANPQQPGFCKELTLSCSDYETAELGIAAYLERSGIGCPDAICLAAAGPVVGERVNIINNHWAIDGAELRQRFSSPKVRLLNDFEAIAYSIPLLTDADISTIGMAPSQLQKKTEFTMVIMGPGTGLGIGGLLGREGRIIPVVGEGGHVGFAPESPVQHKVLRLLRQDFERVSNERLISGPGLENIYRALHRIHFRGYHTQVLGHDWQHTEGRFQGIEQAITGPGHPLTFTRCVSAMRNRPK